MLKRIQTHFTQVASATLPVYSRIISAAVINAGFRSILLSDPIKAVATGYRGEQFMLDGEAKNHLASIHASSLSDFATKLVKI